MAHWIDCGFDTQIGAVGYLVETLNTSNGRTTFSLWERPLRTNVSHEPRLSGWCGETNNRSRYAKGVAKVAKLNARGDRAMVSPLTGADLAAFLAGDGHPELIPTELRKACGDGSRAAVSGE